MTGKRVVKREDAGSALSKEEIAVLKQERLEGWSPMPESEVAIFAILPEFADKDRDDNIVTPEEVAADIVAQEFGGSLGNGADEHIAAYREAVESINRSTQPTQPPAYIVESDARGDITSIKPVMPEAAAEAIRASRRPQTSNIRILMTINGEEITFNGEWLKEVGL